MFIRLIGRTFAMALNIHWAPGPDNRHAVPGQPAPDKPPSRGRLRLTMVLHRRQNRDRQRDPVVKRREKRKTLVIRYKHANGAHRVQLRREKHVSVARYKGLARNPQREPAQIPVRHVRNQSAPRPMPFNVRRFK